MCHKVPSLVRITQNRINEKAEITASGAPVANYITAQTFEELTTKITEVGFPCIVKTAFGGYDGKGQVKIDSKKSYMKRNHFLRIQLVSRKHLFRLQRKFQLLFNVMQQVNHIVYQLLKIFINTIFLHESIVPARVHADVLAKAEEAAMKIADHLELVGTLAVEMFVLENDKIVINELAPRPHNSGHYSIEACNVSQFHQHIRAICGWPFVNQNYGHLPLW